MGVRFGPGCHMCGQSADNPGLNDRGELCPCRCHPTSAAHTDVFSAVKVGDRVQFDSKSTSWLVRAEACDGRYLVVTCAVFGKVYYAIIDYERRIRGPLNVIGQGMGIFTTSGTDEAINEVVRMLEEVNELGAHDWEVSHRNNVPLAITAVRHG